MTKQALPSTVLSRLQSTAASSLSPLLSTQSGLYGFGVDLAHIPRFAGLLQRQGPRFLNKCLHPKEIEQLQRIAAGSGKQDSTTPIDARAAATFLAGRWAAKEALTKAAGKRLLFPEMCVQRDDNKGAEDPRPRLHLSGAALEWFHSQHLHPTPHLSISHDGDFVLAGVVIERLPQQQQQEAQPPLPCSDEQSKEKNRQT